MSYNTRLARITSYTASAPSDPLLTDLLYSHEDQRQRGGAAAGVCDPRQRGARQVPHVLRRRRGR